MSTIQKKDILTLTDDELQNILISFGWKKYRISQVNEWLWKHGIRSIDEMSNLSLTDRQKLKDVFEMHTLALDKMQISFDGTRKYRFNLHDNLKIESVLIPVPEDERYTLCISSQAGCSLTCTFCATGRMGLLRQLTPGEIFDQYLYVNRECIEVYGKPITNIVFMGMGEPLLNYKNVVASIGKFTSPKGANLSHRRITVSTSGIAKMIKKMADDGLKVNLALSLHAADDTKRTEIMPINKQNNLHSLSQALKHYYNTTSNRISIEYICFDHYNDSEKDARNLIRFCSHFPALVNIIEYNNVRGIDFQKSDENTINSFAKHLLKAGIMTTVRKSRGKDIDAACGQLANEA